MSASDPKAMLHGLPVEGYQPQPADAVAAVNESKILEERVLRRLDRLYNSPADRRWLAIARTHVEQGFMAMNRAVFQPSRISLPEDPPP